MSIYSDGVFTKGDGFFFRKASYKIFVRTKLLKTDKSNE